MINNGQGHFLSKQVNPSDKIQSTYEILVNAEEHILSELKDGAKLSDIYNSTVAMVKKQRPELVKVLNVKSHDILTT